MSGEKIEKGSVEIKGSVLGISIINEEEDLGELLKKFDMSLPLGPFLTDETSTGSIMVPKSPVSFITKVR